MGLVCPHVGTSLATSSTTAQESDAGWRDGERTRLMVPSSSSSTRLIFLWLRTTAATTGSTSARARSVPEVKLGRMPALETGAALSFARASPGGGLLLDLSLGVLDVQAMFLESTPGCRTSPSG